MMTEDSGDFNYSLSRADDPELMVRKPNKVDLMNTR